MLDLSHFTILTCTNYLATLGRNLVLRHFRVHHLVVELERALLSQVIVDFALLGLDNKGTLRVDCVG